MPLVLLLLWCWTSVDKKMAFDLYFKAANMNNDVAQYCRTTKALLWYKKSADNG